MSFIGRILPAGGRGNTSPKAEQLARQDAVDKLCNRLSNASLLEDRRAAAQALKSVAKHYQVEIGATALPTLLNALKRDAEDAGLAKNIVETFIAICAEGVEMRREFGEMLLKDTKVLPILLERLTEDHAQHVRFTIVQLLCLLEELLPTKLASVILACPSGLSNLLDLLTDNRDIIRLESISLVRKLAASSQEIQKIAVFEGTLEILFELIVQEGGVFGGQVVVQEALLIIQNLLRHNPANQKYFIESSCFTQFPQLLGLPHRDGIGPFEDAPKIQYTEQKVVNFEDAVEIPMILMYRDNPHLERIQTLFCKANLFSILACYGFDDCVPAAVQIAALNGLSRLVWRNSQGQQLVARQLVNGPKSPQPAILAVIRTCVESLSPNDLPVRLAAAELIASYLSENPDGQLAIAATFKSPKLSGSLTMDEQSAGSVLIDRALDLSGVRRDPFRVWFPCLLLAYILRDNQQCKTLALQHLVSDSDGVDGGAEDGFDAEGELKVSFFAQIMENLRKIILDSKQVDSAAGYLILLSTWLNGYLPAVQQLLSEGSNVQFLIELINQNSTADPLLQGYAAFAFGLLTLFNDSTEGPFTRKALQDIIKSRIGFDVFSARIIRTRDYLNTVLVAKADAADERVFDKSFAGFYLEYCDAVLGLFSTKRRTLSSLISPALLRFEKSVETDGFMEPSAAASNLALFELQAKDSSSTTAHDNNVASKCTYLAKENEQLQRTISAYSQQLLQLEKDHEELLICLASYDSELKQLRQHLAIAEERKEPSDLFAGSNPSDVDIISSISPAAVSPVAAPTPSAPFLDPTKLQSNVVAASETMVQAGALYAPDISLPSTATDHPPPTTPIKSRIASLLHSEAPSKSTHDV